MFLCKAKFDTNVSAKSKPYYSKILYNVNQEPRWVCLAIKMGGKKSRASKYQGCNVRMSHIVRDVRPGCLEILEM